MLCWYQETRFETLKKRELFFHNSSPPFLVFFFQLKVNIVFVYCCSWLLAAWRYGYVYARSKIWICANERDNEQSKCAPSTFRLHIMQTKKEHHTEMYVSCISRKEYNIFLSLRALFANYKHDLLFCGFFCVALWVCFVLVCCKFEYLYALIGFNKLWTSDVIIIDLIMFFTVI